jgi:hypothetical protein
MCNLLHLSDYQKRLGLVNPMQINQSELNLVINEKSDMFKGMSNKKQAATIKKSITKTHQREKGSCINPHRSTNAAVRR